MLTLLRLTQLLSLGLIILSCRADHVRQPPRNVEVPDRDAAPVSTEPPPDEDAAPEEEVEAGGGADTATADAALADVGAGDAAAAGVDAAAATSPRDAAPVRDTARDALMIFSADGSVPPPELPPVSTTDCMPEEHPGKITIVNESAGTTRVEPVENVPESLHFRDTPTGRVPVVTSVYRAFSDGHAEIWLYGPCNQPLDHIVVPAAG